MFLQKETPNCCDEVLVIKKVENTEPWIYFVNDLNDEEIVRTFYKK